MEDESIPEIILPPEEAPKISRRRDPFKGMEFQSSQAGMKGKELASRGELKRIQKANVRHEGQKVITEDVKKLKSISVNPRLPPGEYVNYYIEPVRIEYYIPKESRFVEEIRYLYIPLIDPTPRGNDDILKEAIAANEFLDVMQVMNQHPQTITDILESYNQTLNLYESLSKSVQAAKRGQVEELRNSLYLVEVLSEYEPSLAALNFLGMFQAWNLNWLIRAMNQLDMEFAASDKTISYLIKVRNGYWEEHNLEYDERFEILAALFYEQAFPHRGLLSTKDDYYYNIFDQ